MTLSRPIPYLRSIKFAPFAIISLFLLTNFTGAFMGSVFAPSVSASEQIESVTALRSGDPDLDEIITRAGQREGIDPRFIHAVIWQESKYHAHARSHAGAQGLMQLMPATARRFGCKDPDDVAENIAAGTKYLSWLLQRFEGDVELALAGYNAGEGSVDKYNGVPPFPETQNYVREITSRYGKTQRPLLTAEAKLALNTIPQQSAISNE